jgi:hypothetical protein
MPQKEKYECGPDTVNRSDIAFSWRNADMAA